MIDRARGTLARAALVVVIVAALAAGAYAWMGERSTPMVVASRIAARVADTRPGTSQARSSPSWTRLTTASGIAVDVAMPAVEERCRTSRFACGEAVDRIGDDVGRVLARVDDVRIDDVRAAVVSGSGARYGFAAMPFVEGLETRFAIVDGAASTFVTSTMAARMKRTSAQLLDASLAATAQEPSPTVVAHAARPEVFDVIAAGDPVAHLLSPALAKPIGEALGITTFICAVPERGRLWVSRPDAAGLRALDAAIAERQARFPDAPRPARFAYDVAVGVVRRADLAR